MIQLAQTGRHFAAAGTGSSHYDQAAAGFDIIILSVSVIGNDQRNVGRIIGDDIVTVHFDAERFQTLLEYIGDRLTPVMGNDNTADIQPDATKSIDQAKCVIVVSDPEISAALVAFNIIGRDSDDDLGVFFHFQKHPNFAVRLEAGKDTGSVIVVKQLSAKFQIKLASELLNAVADVL